MKKSIYLLLILSLVLNTVSLQAVVSPHPSHSKKEIRQASKQNKKGFFTRLSEKILVKKAYQMAQKLGLTTEECDQLLLKNGEIKKVNIIEVNSEEVLYRKCKDPEGETLTIPKTDLIKALYANGKELLFATKKDTEPKTQSVYVETEEDLKGAWGKGLLLGVLLGFLGIIFIAISYSGAKRKRMLKGALFGLLIGIVLSILFLVWILSLLNG